jgi:hypothetical protein
MTASASQTSRIATRAAARVNHDWVNGGAKSAALKVKSRLMAQVFGLSVKRAVEPRHGSSVRDKRCIANCWVVEIF